MATTSYNIYQQITSVRLSTTANLSGRYFNGALNNGVGATLTASLVGSLVIDGVSAELGDRVLLIDQTNANENGIYVVQATGGSSSLWLLERSPDFQSIEQLKVGQYLTVGAGDTLAGNFYVLIEPLPSVIGLGDFSFANVPAGGGSSGPFLTIAGNLSDLSNNEEGFTNLGLGSGNDLIIDEGDFVAGVYTLTNPCPNFIFVNSETPGNAVRLPPTGEAQSFIPSQGPVFIVDAGWEPVEIQDQDGSSLESVDSPGCKQFVLTSISAPDGVWFIRPFTMNTNGLNGDVTLTGSNIDSETDPVNYTPIDETIDGHLVGIDNQLGVSNAQDLQDTYDTGSTANINLANGRPILISTINSAASANGVTTPSTGPNTVANYRMGGSVFTVATPRNVTALQYLDATFTQPGTREVGIWIKSTGELLGSATVAKTDPLDGSGLYRTKVLDSAIFLTSGIDYVVAATIYANETNYINPDAVPGTGITLIQSAGSPGSGSPIPLTFPTTYLNETNTTYGGFFQFSTFTTNDVVTFNDNSTDSKTLVEVESTTRATIFEPPMTTAQMNAMGTTNFGSSVFVNDTTPRRPYRYTGVAWRGLAYVDEIPAVPTLTQGQLIIGVTGNPAVAGSITTPNSTLTLDAKTNGEIKIDVLRPMPALVQGELAVGVGIDGLVQQRGSLVSGDGSININTSSAPNIDLSINGGFLTLQSAYTNGPNVTISSIAPLLLQDEAVANGINFYGDGFNPFMQFFGTTNSTVPYGVMTDAQFSSLGTLIQGMIGYTTTSNRLSVYNGMGVKQLAYTTDFLSGTFTPSITNVSNTSSISFVKGFYTTSGLSSGNVVTCTLQFTCSVSATSAVVQIASLPVNPGNFSGTTQAGPIGGNVYVNASPNIGDGQIIDVVSNNGATTLNASFLIANTSGTKVITIGFTYVIQ